VPELSGAPAPPDNSDTSAASLHLSLHSIGGFCALSSSLPVPKSIETEVSLSPLGHGLSIVYEKKVHCVAAEPSQTILRVGVTDGGHEIAFETAVLGRLVPDYRVLPLRGRLGARIELFYLLVRITFGEHKNLWQTSRQLRVQSSTLAKVMAQQEEEFYRRSTVLHEEIATLKRSCSSISERESTVGELKV
jgi:hypothetical protein